MKLKNLLSTAALCAFSALALSSCEKKEALAVKPDEVSQDTLAKISQLGFSSQGVKAVEDGYVVEGDILLTPELLATTPDYSVLRVGQDEQYRTTNLVTGLPRTLTVKLSTRFPAAYITAADEAIRRYNAANLQLKFRRITSGTANLPISYAADLGPGVLGQSGGFPQGGNPAPGFKLVPNVIGNQSTDAIATIMAHELGHCIGMRHTDYFNRAYSCGGTSSNEGASNVGAVLIPGTPSAADPSSWMLACLGNNQNRPFNSNDLIALNYLY